MQTGIYRKIKGRSGIGKLYLLLLVARDHHTDAHSVIYVPLRIEPEWAGTIRPCRIDRSEFEEKFEYVGEELPTPVERQ